MSSDFCCECARERLLPGIILFHVCYLIKNMNEKFPLKRTGPWDGEILISSVVKVNSVEIDIMNFSQFSC